MSEQHSIAEASSNLEELVRKAENGEAVELTRDGECVAVLTGRRESERLPKSRRTFWDALQEFRRSVDLTELRADEVWGDVRDPDPGRDIDL